MMLGILTVSNFSLLAVSIDRYWSICHPISYHKTVTTRFTKLVILICWILSLLGFLPLFGWNSGIFEDTCDAKIVFDFNYVIFLCVTVSFLPAIILLLVYILIYKQVRRRQRTKLVSPVVFTKEARELPNNFSSNDKYFLPQSNQKPNVPMQHASEKETKVAKTLSLVVLSFLICWLPMTISAFTASLAKDREPSDYIHKISIFLSHFNSAIDPLIYAYRIKTVREALKSFVTCKRQQYALWIAKFFLKRRIKSQRFSCMMTYA